MLKKLELPADNRFLTRAYDYVAEHNGKAPSSRAYPAGRSPEAAMLEEQRPRTRPSKITNTELTPAPSIGYNPGMRRKWSPVVLSLLTVAIASGVSATALAGAAAQRSPRLIAGSWTGRRPVDIYISGDAGNIITRIHWRAWTNSYAYGVGTSNILGCVPDCASGSATPVRTTITLSHPSSSHWTKLLEIRRGQRLIAHYGRAFWPVGAR